MRMQVNLVERRLSNGRISGRASALFVDTTTTCTATVVIRVDLIERSFSKGRARGGSGAEFVRRAIAGR